MQKFLTKLRYLYFQEIANRVDKQEVQLIILTHLLEDRTELLAAFKAIASISLVIAIPYSIHFPTLEKIKMDYPVITPSLEELANAAYLKKMVKDHLSPMKPLIILEIGGYFAPILAELSNELTVKLIGVIEDTEVGHRQYLSYQHALPCPVISVARSQLKETEDFLVGSSCLFSTEKILRQMGFPIEGKRSLVLGFGKIGSGLAYALLRSNCPVMVYDSDPIKCVNAISEGFQVPSREKALKEAEVIYGATGYCSLGGQDFSQVRSGSLLVSCSSKNIEFDLSYLDNFYQKQALGPHLAKYNNYCNTLYLAAAGRPINFIDGAVIGPVLALVQAEIIMAIGELLSLFPQKGVFDMSSSVKKQLATAWLHHFCDPHSGRYRHE